VLLALQLGEGGEGRGRLWESDRRECNAMKLILEYDRWNERAAVILTPN